MPFLDFKFLIRDSTAIIDKLIPSTDHYFVKMVLSLRINNNIYNNNKKKSKKLPKPNTENTNPPTPSPTTKPKSAPRRIFLSN